jgi:hypothetical protein
MKYSRLSDATVSLDKAGVSDDDHNAALIRAMRSRGSHAQKKGTPPVTLSEASQKPSSVSAKIAGNFEQSSPRSFDFGSPSEDT